MKAAYAIVLLGLVMCAQGYTMKEILTKKIATLPDVDPLQFTHGLIKGWGTGKCNSNDEANLAPAAKVLYEIIQKGDSGKSTWTGADLKQSIDEAHNAADATEADCKFNDLLEKVAALDKSSAQNALVFKVITHVSKLKELVAEFNKIQTTTPFNSEAQGEVVAQFCTLLFGFKE